MSAPHERRISAEHVLLALVARELTSSEGVRWMAMSNGVNTVECGYKWRENAYRLAIPPLLMPHRTSLTERLVTRVRLRYGLPEIQKTWGTGFKALLREIEPKRQVRP